MIVARASGREEAPLNLVATIRRHWLIVSAGLAVGVAGAVGVWFVSPNRYVAEAVVALDARKVQVITIDSVVSRLPQDSPVLRTELDLIASRSMAEQVAERIGLIHAPQPDDAAPSPLAWLKGLFSPPETTVEVRSPAVSAVDRLVSGLRVNNDGRSYTIFIYFDSSDPAFAKQAANAYAETYLEHQIALQTQATRNASDWLGKKVTELGARLEASETTLEDFRRKAGLVETSAGGTSEGQRLAGVNVELAAARSQRAGAEARLAAANELGRSGGDAAAFNEVLASAPIQALRTREADIGRSIGEIEASGASMSADLPAQRIQLAAVRKQIDGEVQRVIASLANEVDVARRKEKTIEGEVAKLEGEVAQNGEARVELNRLEREAAANRTIYESFLNRYKQTIEQEGLATPDATLLSRAELPMRPASPKLLPLLAFGLVGGGLMGVGLATLRRKPSPSERETEATGPVVIHSDGSIVDELRRSQQQKRA